MPVKTTIGIDLGTSKCCVASVQNGKTAVLPNPRGDATTPSFVSFGDHRYFVGSDAKEQACLNPTNTIYGIKTLLGRTYNDPVVRNYARFSTARVFNSQQQPTVNVKYMGREYHLTPLLIAAIQILNMKQQAEREVGEVEGAVVSVPAYYGNSQREAIVAACQIAGLELLDLISEPTATALSYRENRASSSDQTILVFDMGAAKLDVSVIRVSQEEVRVLAVCGDDNFGGDNLDQCLMELVDDRFEEKHQMGLLDNTRSKMKLKLACEELKKKLTLLQSHNITQDSILNGKDLHDVVTRKKFEKCFAKNFLADLKIIIDSVLLSANLKKSDVDEVVVVGGSSRVPLIERSIRKIFGNKETNKTVNADESVALGAGILANELVKDKKDRCFVLKEMVREPVKDCLRGTFDFHKYVPSEPGLQFLEAVEKPVGDGCTDKIQLCMTLEKYGVIKVKEVKISSSDLIKHEKFLANIPESEIENSKAQLDAFERDRTQVENEEKTQNDLEGFCYEVAEEVKELKALVSQADGVESQCDAVLRWVEDNERATVLGCLDEKERVARAWKTFSEDIKLNVEKHLAAIEEEVKKVAEQREEERKRQEEESKRLEKERKKHEEELKKLKEKQKQEEEKNLAKQREVEKKKEEEQKKKQEEEKEYEEEKKKLAEEHGVIIKKLTEEQENKKKKLTKEQENKKKELTEEQENKKKELTEEQENKKKKLTEEQENKKKELTEEQENKKKELTEEQENKKKELTEEQKNKKKELTEEQENKKKELTEEQKNKKKELTEQQENKKKEMTKEQEDKKKKLVKQHRDKYKLGQMIETKKKAEQWEAEEKTFTRELEIEKEELAEQLDTEKKKLTEQLSAEKKKLTEQLDAEMKKLTEQLSAEKKKLTEQLSAEKKKLTEQLDAEKKKLAEQLDAEKKKLAEQLDAEKKKLAEQQDAEKKKLAEQLDAEKKKLTEQLDAEKKKLMEQLDAEKKKLTEQLDAEKKKQETEKKKLEEQQEAEKKKFAEEQKTKRKELAEQLEAEVTQLAKQQEELKKKLIQEQEAESKRLAEQQETEKIRLAEQIEAEKNKRLAEKNKNQAKQQEAENNQAKQQKENKKQAEQQKENKDQTEQQKENKDQAEQQKENKDQAEQQKENKDQAEQQKENKDQAEQQKENKDQAEQQKENKDHAEQQKENQDHAEQQKENKDQTEQQIENKDHSKQEVVEETKQTQRQEAETNQKRADEQNVGRNQQGRCATHQTAPNGNLPSSNVTVHQQANIAEFSRSNDSSVGLNVVSSFSDRKPSAMTAGLLSNEKVAETGKEVFELESPCSDSGMYSDGSSQSDYSTPPASREGSLSISDSASGEDKTVRTQMGNGLNEDQHGNGSCRGTGSHGAEEGCGPKTLSSNGCSGTGERCDRVPNVEASIASVSKSQEMMKNDTNDKTGCGVN